jgi:hypothetical protein
VSKDHEPLTANCFSICKTVSSDYKKGDSHKEGILTSSRLSASSALKFAGAATDMVRGCARCFR